MSRTKRLLAVLLALCGALLCGCGQRETETEELPVLVIGSDDYEPYFYLDENGAYAGIDVEIATPPARDWAGRRASKKSTGRRRTPYWSEAMWTASGAASP